MAEKIRSLMKIVASEINKHRLFNNASLTISNATGKAQEKLNNMQNAVASKYDIIAKQISNNTTLIQNLNATQLQPSPLPNKVVKWWQWYQQITGLDTVELAKHQVISAQDKLFKCQDERRHLNRQAAIVTDKLKEVYSELINTKRDDPKYVQLTMIENKNLQDQAKIVSQLNLLEKEEKEHFTLLATAIKEYHDSQTMNAQKYKYLSILASAVLAIVSLTGSMIYNNKRITDVRNVIAEAQQKNESVFQNKLIATENNIETNFKVLLEKLEYNINTKYTALVETLENNSKQDATLYHYTKEVETDKFRKVCIVLGICTVGIYMFRALVG
ncbi:uncharacterized protein LOC143187490 [Calliopsis andreniformis]|uniref:uncharacterized protein LOC143187490 n=1 Tax=Calliopsis andreniformis TaxID=337506 RepID=UPI003FCEBF9D